MYHHHHHHHHQSLPPHYHDSNSPTVNCSSTSNHQTILHGHHSPSITSLPPQVPFLLNLTTLPTNVSFISGHLAIDQTTLLEGEVQFKPIDSFNTSDEPRPDHSNHSYSCLSVSFRAYEQSSNAELEPIELDHRTIKLWDRSSDPLHPTRPPGILPFQFILTEDLPHCIHPSNHHGLNYQLIASLVYHQHQPQSDANPSTLNPPIQFNCTVPIHISRYSNPNQHPSPPPAPLSSTLTSPNHSSLLPSSSAPSPSSSSSSSSPSLVSPSASSSKTTTTTTITPATLIKTSLSSSPFSLSPVQIRSYSPTPISISLSQTLLRHSEPLALQIRIPPPSQQLIEEKGLRLRSVCAQLRRHIQERSSTPDNPDQITTTVLAVSGKSCRFSSTRDVFLRLTLHSCLARPSSTRHPGSISSSDQLVDHRPSPIETISRCETITQSTILFDVYFTLLVVVNIVGRDGERQDVEIQRDIGIVPDWPPLPMTDLSSSPVSVSKAREAAEETKAHEYDKKHSISSIDSNGPVPKYLETDDSRVDFQGRLAEASTSQLVDFDFQLIGPLDWDNDDDVEDEEEEEEEEYDGYESFSFLAGADGPAPPTIDEDESPPPAPDTPPEGIELQSPLIIPPDHHHIPFDDLSIPQSTNLSTLTGLRMSTIGSRLTPYPQGFRSIDDVCSPITPPNRVVEEDGSEHPPLSSSNLSTRHHPPNDQDQGLCGNHDRLIEDNHEEEVGRPPAYRVGWLNQTHQPPQHHHESSTRRTELLENIHHHDLNPPDLENRLSSMFLNLAGHHSVHHTIDSSHPPPPHHHHSSLDPHTLQIQLPNPNDPIISSDGSIQPPPYAAGFS